jgi:TonB family protein
MPRRFTVGLLTVAVLAVVAQPFSLGQQEDQEVKRKVINKTVPAYPELARRMNIRGTVKVGVLITPNGSVKSTNVIGGNPVLVLAAVDAIRRWKYEPASGERSELVELKFDPR